MKNILSPLIDACQWVLEFWHDLVGGSWGWSIILLTFTVRLFILPLTFRGVKSMQRLQSFQPEIKAIQERYKDDRQRMNQEVMAFYQRAISPALPARCKYHPSCSQYAVEAVRRYGVLRGIVLAGWRLLRCNPWSHGGVDFVEDQTLFRTRPNA